ncbi:hypothetical protein SAMN04489844_3552 [Nocardioides exalbidus]|uniref:Uncharacterized protein n=1 Tax=Nocardioides exalbidus TaxID=402596 RepID=A0A1H4XHK3_9ACTN|nr:hypothetical protein [Nocardioides exalbidus]SED04630.1 hypothetical protein SAMN04489844_3552 [Nocardioides exalbidus]
MEYDWARGDVIQADGVEVARASRSWFRERAEVEIGPEVWEFRSNGWGGSELTASLAGTVHYGARRSGFLTSRWTISVGDELDLRTAGLFSSRLTLSRAGTPIGEVTRSGIFTGRPRLTVSEPLDTRAGCFVLWVSYVELNRQSSDGGAAAAAT